MEVKEAKDLLIRVICSFWSLSSEERLVKVRNSIEEFEEAIETREGKERKRWIDIAEAARGKILQYEKQIEKYKFRANEYQGMEVELREEIKRLKLTILYLTKALEANIDTSDLMNEISWSEILGLE